MEKNDIMVFFLLWEQLLSKKVFLLFINLFLQIFWEILLLMLLNWLLILSVKVIWLKIIFFKIRVMVFILFVVFLLGGLLLVLGVLLMLLSLGWWMVRLLMGRRFCMMVLVMLFKVCLEIKGLRVFMLVILLIVLELLVGILLCLWLRNGLQICMLNLNNELYLNISLFDVFIGNFFVS